VDLLQAIVLGLIQGLTEFLPISSSGHLRIAPAMFGWEDPGAAFTAVTQLGTEAAVLIYFRHDLWRVATTWLGALRDPALRATHDARMGWYLIIATVPLALFGLTFEEQIETGARNLWLIASMLIVFGLVLWFADRRGTQARELERISFRDGVIIGLAQSLALIPGVSRAGATMTAGLLLGLKRPAAARFSFLLAIPAVVTSGFYQLYSIIIGEEGGGEPIGYVLVATAIAFVAGYLTIAWLLRFLATHTVGVFVVYRVVLGTVVLALLAAGAIE